MKKILLVEDEILTSLDLKKILTEHGYEVVDRVFTGEAAFMSFQKHRPDIIIMDIHLKGKMTGYDAAKEIVQFADPYFLFLSNTGYDMYLRGTGIKYEYLAKPFTEEQILERLGVIA